MSATIVPPLAVAPMEGLTGFVFRQVFSRHFTGADDWFIPFVTPTTLPQFTDRPRPRPMRAFMRFRSF